MITYVGLAIMFLFVLVKTILYWRRNREMITSEELDRTLLLQINRESDNHEQ